MPISEFLDDQKFDPETRRLMGLAFEMARAALRLDRNDPAVERVARKIIEIAKSGERDPDRLCESAMQEFRERRP